MKRLIVAAFLLTLLALPALAADSPFADVEWGVAYGYSLHTESSLAISKAGVKVAKPSVWGQDVAIKGDLLGLFSEQEKATLGLGLSATLSDATVALDLGVGYFPHNYEWTIYAGLTSISF